MFRFQVSHLEISGRNQLVESLRNRASPSLCCLTKVYKTTLIGISPTPKTFGLTLMSHANTNAAGLAIKETPSERQRLYEPATTAAPCGGSRS